MLAVDTNIVVRYLTADDPAQFARAVAVVENAETFLSLTVLLETEWVLRSTYQYEPSRIVDALRGFASLPLVTVESAGLAATALDWMAAGMDFADALHVAAAERCEAFVTFDRQLGRFARRIGGISVRVL